MMARSYRSEMTRAGSACRDVQAGERQRDEQERACELGSGAQEERGAVVGAMALQLLEDSLSAQQARKQRRAAKNYAESSQNLLVQCHV